jgi:hypothetical protein
MTAKIANAERHFNWALFIKFDSVTATDAVDYWQY